MIDFRYHVVSIIAVFLALALGLFIGSTSLQDAVVHTIKGTTDRVARENTALQSQLDQTTARLKNTQTFDKALLPYAVNGRLSGQQISVVSAPGTSDGVRKQVLTALTDAGATVTADVRLQPSFVDPKQGAFLTALAQRITLPTRPTPSPTATAAPTGEQQAAEQLAAVLGTRPGTHAIPDATVATVLSAYAAAKLVSFGGSAATPRPGTLALLISGPPAPATADATQVRAQQQPLLDLAAALDQSALGAVVVAPTPPQNSAQDIIGAANGVSGLTQHVSTVSGVDTASGQIATVFALAAQLDGVAGHFGLTGTPLPTPSATP